MGVSKSTVATFALASLAGLAHAADVCNGYAALCDKLYSNVTFAGAHDASFVGSWLADNQDDSVTAQLDLGIRFMEVQSHDSDGTIELCHTSCLEEDSGSLEDFLTTVKTWMDSNTEDVVTLLITNDDDLAVSEFGAVFEAVGLDSYAYAPGSDLTLSEWPTLGELIDDGTRLVVFMDYDADTSSVPYILDEFGVYYWETPYDVTDASDFDTCTVDRPSGLSDPTSRMFIINHFLDVDVLGVDIPDWAEESTTNSVSSIFNQADVCAGLYGRYPNVVLMDYVNDGSPVTAVAEMNGVA